MFQNYSKVVFSWSDSLQKEEAFLKNVVSWSQGNKTTSSDIVVAKFCGTNGVQPRIRCHCHWR